MDYRLVKQFLNHAIDAFFNFFYKISDFVVVFLDLGWAFFDIWYQFFAIFGNLILYVYYLILFILDKLSVSSAPIFFWRKSYSRKTTLPKKAYSKNFSNPIPAMYKTSPTVKAATTTVTAASESVKSAKENVVSTFKPKSGKRSSRKESKVKIIFMKMMSSIGEGFRSFGSKLYRFWVKFLDKLKPVKDDVPAGRKSLIDDYMKEYERKKNHR